MYMCKGQIHKIIELRSEDGDTTAPGTAYASTHKRFTNMDFRGLLNDHPEGDRGLWNVKVVYFNLYQPQGLINASSIDIQIDEITSPFTLSSRPTGGLTIGTATAHVVNDIDNSDGSEYLPVGFSVKADESFTQTCRIAFTNWNVKLQRPRIKDGEGLHLQSTTGDDSNTLVDWTLRLELTHSF